MISDTSEHPGPTNGDQDELQLSVSSASVISDIDIPDVDSYVPAVRVITDPHPGSHLGAILERFGSPRGSIFKPLSFHFALLEAMR